MVGPVGFEPASSYTQTNALVPSAGRAASTSSSLSATPASHVFSPQSPCVLVLLKGLIQPLHGFPDAAGDGLDVDVGCGRRAGVPHLRLDVF